MFTVITSPSRKGLSMPSYERHFKENHKEIKAYVPQDVLVQVEERLWDPGRGKPIYGARSALIAALLRRWLADPSIVPLRVIEETL